MKPSDEQPVPRARCSVTRGGDRQTPVHASREPAARRGPWMSRHSALDGLLKTSSGEPLKSSSDATVSRSRARYAACSGAVVRRAQMKNVDVEKDQSPRLPCGRAGRRCRRDRRREPRCPPSKTAVSGREATALVVAAPVSDVRSALPSSIRQRSRVQTLWAASCFASASRPSSSRIVAHTSKHHHIDINMLTEMSGNGRTA